MWLLFVINNFLSYVTCKNRCTARSVKIVSWCSQVKIRNDINYDAFVIALFTHKMRYNIALVVGVSSVEWSAEPSIQKSINLINPAHQKIANLKMSIKVTLYCNPSIIDYRVDSTKIKIMVFFNVSISRLNKRRKKWKG